MALPNRATVPTVALDIGKMSIEDRIKYLVELAAARLPANVGRQLLTLIEPKSLATVAGVLAVWTGAQLFGVGEIADVVLLIGGYAMFGAVAFDAGRLIYQCGRLIVQAKDKGDLDQAATMLVQAVTLIGVQGALAILLDKPGNAFKKQFFATNRDPNPAPFSSFRDLPTNRWWGYVPKTEGDTTYRFSAGMGDTSVTGDIRYSLKGSETDRRMALAHEQVHQFLSPKLRVLRQLRTFIAVQGYNRSYVLRYIEEAMAETIAQIRVKGLTKANVIEGIRFPIGSGYDVTVGTIKGELRQVFLGPITVGGMTYQVWCSRRVVTKKGVHR
jgi:hypothetical protein